MPPMIVNEAKPRRLREVRKHRALNRLATKANNPTLVPRVEISDGRLLPLTKQQIKSRRSNPEAPIKLSKKQEKKMIKRVLITDTLRARLASGVEESPVESMIIE